MSTNPIVISARGLTQRFRVIQERPDTVRELFARFFRQKAEYHDFDAVRNVSFDVRAGEMLGIIGRNGSGKSTLLKIVAGVYRPTLGEVQVRGSIAPLIELGAGMHGELTGRENIILNGLLMGFSKREMLSRQEEIIEFADIGDFIDAPVKQYSSGMFMRLAFSVATQVDPDILAVDEILAVGDAQFKEKCFERLRQFRRAGKTILFVTHSMDQILEHCDRAILLDQGRIVIDGAPEQAVELYNNPVPSVPSAAELEPVGQT